MEVSNLISSILIFGAFVNFLSQVRASTESLDISSVLTECFNINPRFPQPKLVILLFKLLLMFLLTKYVRLSQCIMIQFVA